MLDSIEWTHTLWGLTPFDTLYLELILPCFFCCANILNPIKFIRLSLSKWLWKNDRYRSNLPNTYTNQDMYLRQNHCEFSLVIIENDWACTWCEFEQSMSSFVSIYTYENAHALPHIFTTHTTIHTQKHTHVTNIVTKIVLFCYSFEISHMDLHFIVSSYVLW